MHSLKKSFFTIVLVSLYVLTLHAQSSQISFMPEPKDVKWNDGKFRITNELFVGIKGNPNERIFPAATRMLRRLDARTGSFFLQAHITKENNSIDSANVVVYCLNEGEIKLGEDESYKLTITPHVVLIESPKDIGAMHGMETLLQMISVDDEGYYFPACEINDEPRFPWRGLLMDVCRHFMPIDVIKRNLDALAAVKMNVFHWHLSEDQGFRAECKTFPKLQELGSDGFYYTHEQIKEVIQYAADRGIRVIPEFDMPGHATAWFVGYPKLASAPGPYSIERNWGIHDPTMDPTKEYTYEFLDKFIGEMADLFPDEYFHIGGDENNGKQWDANTDIQKFMKDNAIKDNHQLQAYFNNRILKILTKHGKKMIGWDEILHEDMPKSIVIHSWRGKEALYKSAKEGYNTILSNGYYIDLIQPASFHYMNDPVPADAPLTEEEKKNILGGEATSWAELVTPETVDSRIWPRTAAIAERLWSPQTVNDVDNMYERLDRISFLLEEHGLLHIKNYQMMLRRLTNNQDITHLKTLVDVVEPVKFYQRHFQGVKYSQHSPYTRVVDAALPESKTASMFDKMIDRFIADKNETDKDSIRAWLYRWRDNHDKLKPVMQKSPIIWEMDSLSMNLSNLATIGIEAMNLIRENKKAPSPWLDKAYAFINEAKKPYGQVELRLVEPIQKLIDYAK